MKILLVIDNLDSGGAQRLFINLANGLSQFYDISILLYNFKGQFFYSPKEEINLITIQNTNIRGIKIKTIIKIWKEMKNYDFIISFMPSSNIYCSICRFLFNWNNKLICNEVSVNNILESKFKRFITNFSYLNANYIICNTYKQAAYLKQKPFLKSKTFTIFNGCEVKDFKERSKKDHINKLLIIVGRIAYTKNGLSILKALKLFNFRNNFLPKVKWAGRVDNSRLKDKQSFRKMNKFLRENKIIKSNFEFIGEVKDINKLYEKADGLISASIFEGLPNVICEAMFCGCPIIASDISDNSIILGNNQERGILCDPLSEESICKGLEKLIFLDDKKLEFMISNARKYAIDNFDNKNMIKKYRNLIEVNKK